jgi:hypothetical protein
VFIALIFELFGFVKLFFNLLRRLLFSLVGRLIFVCSTAAGGRGRTVRAVLAVHVSAALVVN